MNGRNYVPTEGELGLIRMLLNEKATQIQLLQQQVAILEAEFNQLGGVLHPIRSCPSDVLKVIFEWTTLFSAIKHPFSLELSNEDWFKAATRLSHVCQRWRSITLDTPKLWGKLPGIALFPVDNNDALFWERTLPRIRGYPAEISLCGFGRFSGFQNVNGAYISSRFHEIPHILRLDVELNGEESLQHLFHPLLRMPQGIVEEVRIISEMKEDIYLDEIFLPALMRTFPSLERLSLFDVTFCCSKIVSFRNIKHLRLQDVMVTDMGSLSRQFQNLRRLYLGTLDDVLPTNGTWNFPVLAELTIALMTSLDDFVKGLVCPKLVEFNLHLSTSRAVMDFIGQHSTTLRRIQLLECEFSFKVLALIAREVTQLTVNYDPSMFTEDKDETGPILLQKLECFTMVDWGNELTMEEFERIVTRYALPLRHEPGDFHEYLPVNKLTIGIPSNEPSTALWVNSPLYQKANEINFERDSDLPDILFIAMSWFL
jgi:hypothetical protein